MRGKIVNLCIGSMNILLGILLVIYTKFVPMEITELTLQELSVTSTILKAIHVMIIIIFFIDILQYRNNRDNSGMKTGYLFRFFYDKFFRNTRNINCKFCTTFGTYCCFSDD